MALKAAAHLGPYEIVELLGAGGMGEVYRARDPRLGRDVAIKVLPAEVASDPDRLRRFEQEARAVAALNHPHILTVHDVGTHEGAPYVVTELLEGENLRELASRRFPTVKQVLGYALQAARGLEAAHARDIVHRDLKPENLFLTTDGRVKILDFGLAKLVRREELRTEAPTPSRSTAAGLVVGTVAYMSPEQARGHPVDPRSDVFSFGVVLYELLAGRHPFRRDTAAATLTAIVEETPTALESLSLGIPSAVGGIVRRCLEKTKEDRYASGHEVAMVLEAVLAAPSQAVSLLEVEERSPYPGLSSFTEKDAAVFFGREREVDELWGRIRSRKLLAVIGPSGVGKTSFVRAGVIASRPEGWAAVHATPGSNPALGLAQALTPELVGDAEAMKDLLRGVADLTQTGEAGLALSALKRWRSRHAEALLIVDQLEELFTLNPPEMQARVASLLRRIASEVDVHVVLSMRDDFLIRCSDHESLAPVFESLTPLTALTPDGLRRAVVEPAKKQGYRFEEDALVDEMVSAVEGVRGALPLLAFAVARLWEKRDRERKLLTRAAYQEIAGVEGALAQHAEATMDRIGPERQGLVREIFRNLVTAQGTRAVIDREELLSAFPDRPVAEEVLRQLIDARLLTTYEVEGKEGEPGHHRVEVIHESLLRAWPRLVRWQAQDEEGAVLRDQLKQAAHLWHEKGRTSDILWTGTAYQEYELWRERYAGALTALEEDFARSMADKARRKRRLLRFGVGTAFVTLTAVAIAIGLSRQQAARARDQAKAEALRAEAGRLLALGRTHLETDATAALAYARASLELFDTPDVRRFAVEVLWHAPVARILPVERMAREAGIPDDPSPIWDIALSPDGRWLATRSGSNRRVLIFPREGGPPRSLPRPPDGNARVIAFGPRGDLLITGGSGESLRFWSLPELREIRSAELGGVRSVGAVRGGKLVTSTRMTREDRSYLIRAWPLPDGEPKVVGTFNFTSAWDVDASGTTLAYGRGRTVRLHSLDPARPSKERILGQSRDEVQEVAFAPRGDRLASRDRSGEIRIWSRAGRVVAPPRILQGPRFQFVSLGFGPEGRLLSQFGPNNAVYLWDLEGPPESQPVVAGRPGPGALNPSAFDPGGQWLATSYGIDTVEFWPLGPPSAREIRGVPSSIWNMAFTSDGRWLATCPFGDPARLWPLNAADGSARDLVPREPCTGLATHPTRGEILVGTGRGEILLFPTAAGPPRRLPGGWRGAAMAGYVAFDPSGRWALAGPVTGGTGLKDPRQRVLRVWDLESGQERVLSVAHLTDADWGSPFSLGFAADGSVYGSLGKGGKIMRLTLPTEPGGEVLGETVVAAGSARCTLSRDGRLLLVKASESLGMFNEKFEQLLLFDLARQTSRRITTHGTRLSHVAAQFDPSGRAIVTGDVDGVVRVGPVTGEEPHLLLGHQGMIMSVAVSPDGRWIASATDESIRLWPMPDVTKPPLHTLPRAELLTKLDAFTNLRVVRDPTSSTGWKLDVGPFPGWQDVPTW
jgi:WD40 repeat protein